MIGFIYRRTDEWDEHVRHEHIRPVCVPSAKFQIRSHKGDGVRGSGLTFDSDGASGVLVGVDSNRRKALIVEPVQVVLERHV